MAKYIRTLTVITDTEIHNKEVPLFRGAVLKSIGEKASMLFHNHTGDNTFRYSYPLIQYKRLNGRAAIVCVEEAVDLIGQFLTETNEKLIIGAREVEWHTSKILPARLLVQTWDYQLYQNTEGVIEKTTILENILKGNLLSMLKGLDIHIEKEILVKITQISDYYLIYNKGVGMMAFNADFISNLSIPNFLGIGKNASIGCGVVHQVKKENDNNK